MLQTAIVSQSQFLSIYSVLKYHPSYACLKTTQGSSRIKKKCELKAFWKWKPVYNYKNNYFHYKHHSQKPYLRINTSLSETWVHEHFLKDCNLSFHGYCTFCDYLVYLLLPKRKSVKSAELLSFMLLWVPYFSDHKTYLDFRGRK